MTVGSSPEVLVQAFQVWVADTYLENDVWCTRQTVEFEADSPYCTVATLMERVATVFDVKGRYLDISRDGQKTLGECGVKWHDTISLKSDKVDIYITFEKKVYTICLESTRKIDDIKAAIERKISVPIDKQSLLFAGGHLGCQRLLASGHTLEESGIGSYTTISLMKRLS